MNIYGIIILCTLLFEYALNLFADIVNLKTLHGELPAEFVGIYDQKAYSKSQEYTRVNTRFGFITSAVSLILTLIFWFACGFNYLDSIVRQWHIGPIWTGLAYVGMLVLLRAAISVPFNIYSTFVIEERFGFNKTTPKTYVLDLVKIFFLSIVLGGPLLAGILAFFQFAGDLAWLYCWIATTVFTLIIQFIAPTWILPLFNKFKPLEDGDLKEAIFEYARSVKFFLSNIFIMDGSKRSSKSNAFFTGFGRNKRIALFDTLIEKHAVAELVAVLAHEIGHYKKKHILITLFISILHMGVVFFLLSVFISHRGLFDAFYMDEMSIYAGLLFFGMLYTPIELILSVLLHVFSRHNEYQADLFAIQTIENPDSMITALKGLSVDNLSNLRPHPFYVFLNYSHPPVLERIRAIREWQKT